MGLGEKKTKKTNCSGHHLINKNEKLGETMGKQEESETLSLVYWGSCVVKTLAKVQNVAHTLMGALFLLTEKLSACK